MATELIPPQTGAVTSKFIQVGDREIANFIVHGLTGAEVIPILQSWDGGTSSEQAKENDVLVQLSADNLTISVKGPIRVAADKPVTAESVGVRVFVKGSI